MSETIMTLQAIFQSARTTVDGGLRISFDLDESQASLLPQLLKWKHRTLNIAIQPDTEPAYEAEGCYGPL
jgi:hypothetical protein